MESQNDAKGFLAASIFTTRPLSHQPWLGGCFPGRSWCWMYSQWPHNKVRKMLEGVILQYASFPAIGRCCDGLAVKGQRWDFSSSLLSTDHFSALAVGRWGREAGGKDTGQVFFSEQCSVTLASFCLLVCLKARSWKKKKIWWVFSLSGCHKCWINTFVGVLAISSEGSLSFSNLSQKSPEGFFKISDGFSVGLLLKNVFLYVSGHLPSDWSLEVGWIYL